MFIVDGQLTLVKKTARAAKGLLSHLAPKIAMTDEESLQSVICDRNWRYPGRNYRPNC